MEINPNRNVDGPANVGASPVKARSAQRADAEEETQFTQSLSLDSALDKTPDTRADVVARAETLVSSSEYPPPEMIKRIANLLAANLIEQN